MVLAENGLQRLALRVNGVSMETTCASGHRLSEARCKLTA
jgi:hypothetical protein